MGTNIMTTTVPLTWTQPKTGAMPDADTTVLLWLRDADGAEDWCSGWLDADGWRDCASGDLVAGQVVAWADVLGPGYAGRSDQQLAADVAMLEDALAPLVDIVAERASGLGADDWARLEDGRQALALVDETQPPFRQGGRSDLAVRLNAMADGWLCAGLPDADLLRKAAREIERLHAALQINARVTGPQQREKNHDR